MIYWIALFVFYLFALKCNSRLLCKKRHLICIFGLLFGIAAFNYGLGNDTESYINHFYSIPKIDGLSHYDFDNYRFLPFWTVIMSFFKTICPTYLFYQIVHAFFINLALLLLFKRYSSNVALTVILYAILYYFDLNFEIQRESFCIIIGVVIFHLMNSIENKKKFFLLFVALSALAINIHYSGLILLFYPLIGMININKRSIIVFYCLCLLLPIIWSSIPNVDFLLAFATDDHFSDYLNQEFNQNRTAFFYINVVISVVTIPFIMLSMASKYKVSKYMPFALMCILFESLSQFSFAFHRFAGYFSPFFWLALTDVVMYIEKRYRISRSLLIIIVSVFVVYAYRAVYFQYEINNHKFVYERYFPYQSIFEDNNNYPYQSNRNF